MVPGQLKTKAEFDRVFSQGQSVANRLFVLYRAPAEGSLKAGIIVSRRVGNAVVRNRVRRRVREVLRNQVDASQAGGHLVIIARNPAATAEFPEILEALVSLLRRTGLAG